jgi:hypothetical protein
MSENGMHHAGDWPVLHAGQNNAIHAKHTHRSMARVAEPIAHNWAHWTHLKPARLLYSRREGGQGTGRPATVVVICLYLPVGCLAKVTLQCNAGATHPHPAHSAQECGNSK